LASELRRRSRVGFRGSGGRAILAGLQRSKRDNRQAMLLTYFVSSGARSYATQQVVAQWKDAPAALVTSEGFRQFAQVAMPVTSAEPLRPDEVFLLTPMTGLTSAWLAQGGRAGEYFSAVIVSTAEAD
jgi:hypothetical protein